MSTAVAVTERPILMNGPMVRAILDGRKTQTRRVITPQPANDWVPSPWPYDGAAWSDRRCPYGGPGDRLWVRETWAHQPAINAPAETWYRADFVDGESYNATMPWRPSIHMPRWASRITLEITAVGVERVQDISEADAQAEGVTERTRLPGYEPMYAMTFARLWDEINGPRGYGWAANPWVWVVEFKRA